MSPESLKSPQFSHMHAEQYIQLLVPKPIKHHPLQITVRTHPSLPYKALKNPNLRLSPLSAPSSKMLPPISLLPFLSLLPTILASPTPASSSLPITTIIPRAVTTVSDSHPASYPRPVLFRGANTNVIFHFQDPLPVSTNTTTSIPPPSHNLFFTYNSNGTGWLQFFAARDVRTLQQAYGYVSDGDGATKVVEKGEGRGRWDMEREGGAAGGMKYVLAVLRTEERVWVNVTGLWVEYGG